MHSSFTVHIFSLWAATLQRYDLQSHFLKLVAASEFFDEIKPTITSTDPLPPRSLPFTSIATAHIIYLLRQTMAAGPVYTAHKKDPIDLEAQDDSHNPDEEHVASTAVEDDVSREEFDESISGLLITIGVIIGGLIAVHLASMIIGSVIGGLGYLIYREYKYMWKRWDVTAKDSLRETMAFGMIVAAVVVLIWVIWKAVVAGRTKEDPKRAFGHQP